MALLTDENYVSLNEKDKKRKNIEGVEKVEKKKKKKNTFENKKEANKVIETVKEKTKEHVLEGIKKEPDSVEVLVEKVKKKKKNKNQVTEVVDANTDEPIVNNSFNSTEGTKSKSKSTKVAVLPTVTIAVPGSILDNAQSPEFRTYLAGQIARAACIYKIDEVCFVVFLFNF